MRSLALALLLPIWGLSAPKGASVSHGQVQIERSGLHTTVRTSKQAVIHWETFSIGSQERVEFVQPSSDSSVINRVAKGATVIDGLLKANGRVFLLNPNGVLVGKQGIVSCASFLATTLNFDDGQGLLGGEILCAGNATGGIVNCGTIEALSGDVVLLAKVVVNEGRLKAGKGLVGIAAARQVLLKPEGSQRLFISMRQEEGSIESGGVIEAARAEIKADGNVYRLAINQKGVIEARGIVEQDGQIILKAEGGRVETSGTLRAQSGAIHILGDEVHIADGAYLDASGPEKGGEVLIGRAASGPQSQIQTGERASVAHGAYVDVSANVQGNGGRVVIWGDRESLFAGRIVSRGGPEGGDGGFVEISSPGTLGFSGSVDLRPYSGSYGTLLLDPSDVTISSSATSGTSLTNGVYVPQVASVTINASDLSSALAMGNVQVTTTSNFSADGDIMILEGLMWNAATTLSLNADRDITFDLPASQSVQASSGGSIVANCNRNCNVLGNSNVLVLESGTVSISCGGDFTMLGNGTNAAFITTEEGGIAVNARGHVQVCAPQQGASISSGSGKIAINQAAGFEDSGDILIGRATDNATSGIGSSSGDIAIRTGGALIVQGGGDSAQALIGSPFGDIDCAVGSSVSVIGGDGANATALIGHYRDPLQDTGSGLLRFSSIGGDLIVRGGGGTSSDAIVGSSPFNAGDWTFVGDIELSSIRGDVEVVASNGAALIGFGAGSANTAYSGNLTIDAQRNIVITAGNQPAIIGFRPSGSTFLVESGRMDISGRNVFINGGMGQFAAIGYPSTSNAVASDVTIASLNVEAMQTVSLTPGSSFNSVNGDALIGVFTEDGTALSEIWIGGERVSLRGGVDLDASSSRIQTASGNPLDMGHLQVETNTLDVGVGGGRLESARIFATGALLVLAEDDLFLRSSSFVVSEGDLTLVADFNPTSPLTIGDGSLTIDPGAQLTTSSGLRIFTARRESTLIQAPLNGAPFFPGPLYIDTASERWASAYPNVFGGIPFTLFYKSGIDPLWPTKSTRIFAEMFAKLQTYDQLAFVCKCFLFGFDQPCYDQLFRPKDMVSSFDLFYDEDRSMLRQKYRNYELQYVESF